MEAEGSSTTPTETEASPPAAVVAKAAATAPEDDAQTETSTGEPDHKSTTPTIPASIVTRTQQAIRTILKVDSARTPGDALLALVGLEARQLPATISTSQLDPRQNPRICCFDVSNVPSAWSSQTVCARCSGLNELLQLHAQQPSSALITGLVGNTLYATDCVSAQKHQGKPPELPFELMEIVIEFAMEDMRRTKKGATVCALMHTNSLVRWKIVQAFAQPRLYEVPVATASAEKDELCATWPIVQHVWQAVQSSVLTDFTAKRYGPKEPQIANKLEQLITVNGDRGTRLNAAITISADKIPLASGKHANAENLAHAWTVGTQFQFATRAPTYGPPLCTNNDVQAALSHTLGLVKPALRFASPFHRAKHGGSFGLPSTSSIISVTLTLQSLSSNPATAGASKTWRFRTTQYRAPLAAPRVAATTPTPATATAPTPAAAYVFGAPPIQPTVANPASIFGTPHAATMFYAPPPAQQNTPW